MKIVVVGAGITGATAAHALHNLGHDVTVYEAEATVGGNLRTASFNGVPYEPHGPHIFHTSDEEVWKLLNGTFTLNGYRHRVLAAIPDDPEERLVTWPLQVGELKKLREWPTIAAELDSRPGHPEGANFEDYAVSLMGPTLYSWFCEGYTWKQWGQNPRSLSASFAPKRLHLRTDDNPDMFRDPWQGYAIGGWHTLVERLIRHVPVVLNYGVTLSSLPDADGYVITAPLDEFLETEPLPWRGVISQPNWIPEKQASQQPAGVVNYSTRTVPWTRVVDTRHMLWPEVPDFNKLGLAQVLVREYPGAPVKHYPVDDVAGENRRRHKELVTEVARRVPNSVLAGRLAQYVYVDIDQAMRQGLNAARKLHKQLTVKE